MKLSVELETIRARYLHTKSTHNHVQEPLSLRATQKAIMLHTCLPAGAVKLWRLAGLTACELRILLTGKAQGHGLASFSGGA